MTEFTERYKKLSNTELLRILAEPERYQPLAVETAKMEIETRQLSEEEVSQINIGIEAELQNKQKESAKRKQQEEALKADTLSFFEAINPIQIGIQSFEKQIRTIIIVFTLLTLYSIYREFGLMYYIFSDSNSKWDLSMVEYFFPLILLPFATFFFWKRKKAGWILLAVFLLYSAINTIAIFIMNIGRDSPGLAAIDALYPTISPLAYLIPILFFGGILWMICKKDIRRVYNATKRTMWRTIGLTTVTNLIYILIVVRS